MPALQKKRVWKDAYTKQQPTKWVLSSTYSVRTWGTVEQATETPMTWKKWCLFRTFNQPKSKSQCTWDILSRSQGTLCLCSQRLQWLILCWDKMGWNIVWDSWFLFGNIFWLLNVPCSTRKSLKQHLDPVFSNHIIHWFNPSFSRLKQHLKSFIYRLTGQTLGYSLHHLQVFFPFCLGVL